MGKEICYFWHYDLVRIISTDLTVRFGSHDDTMLVLCFVPKGAHDLAGKEIWRIHFYDTPMYGL